MITKSKLWLIKQKGFIKNMSTVYKNKKDVLRFWVQVVSFYQKELSDEVIAMYVQDTNQYSLKQLSDAFHIHRRKWHSFPLPHDLARIIENTGSHDAGEIVAKILQAFGRFSPTEGYSAMQWVGSELGEEVGEIAERAIGDRFYYLSQLNTGSAQRDIYNAVSNEIKQSAERAPLRRLKPPEGECTGEAGSVEKQRVNGAKAPRK